MIDKRQQILDATADMIVEYGLQACPMSKISARANCGAGTIYRYFETKQDLVFALFIDLFQKLTVACSEGYDETAPLRTRFERLWGNYYRYILANPNQRALMEQLISSPAICQQQKDEAINGMMQQIDHLLEDGKQQGVFKELPNSLLNTVTFGTLSMMAKKQQQFPDTHPCGACTEGEIIGLCWDALKR
ncbi:TetR/AcrR family transcriptional regulator [Oceanobacter mangrovi]|uniref:TetR/AcrR family transcriptional regulator n=1 Tax=Oceanobacter mangrovi TaxID=2862510 RepID=UPI001C8D101B|nr:TetR/AcrR family transcriptional regulator [Oceanobacter mangrovi]